MSDHESPPSVDEMPKELRRRLRWQFVVAALLLALIAFRVALPSLLEARLPAFLSRLLDVRVTVGSIDLDLREGGLVANEVALRVPGAPEDLMRASRLSIDADWEALLGGELLAERIQIDTPEIFLTLDADGSFNWSALGGKPGPKQARSEPAERSRFLVSAAVFQIDPGRISVRDGRAEGLPPFDVSVGGLTLKGADVGRSTPDAPVAWSLGDVEAKDWSVEFEPGSGKDLTFALELEAARPDADGRIPVELDLSRTDGVALTIRGTVRPGPFGFDLTADWKGLRSKAVAPLVLRGARVDRGVSDAKLGLVFDLGDGPARGLAVTGEVTHEDLELEVDNDPPIGVRVERFEGEISRIFFPLPQRPVSAPAPIEVGWKHIKLERPEVEIGMPSARAAGEASQTKATAAATPSDGATALEADASESAPASEPAGDDAAGPDPVADGSGGESGARELETATGDVAAEADDGGEPVPPDEAVLNLDIDALSFSDGSFAWHDDSLGSESRQQLSDIDFAAKLLHWPPTTLAHVKLSLGSLGSKPLTVEGEVRADGADLVMKGHRIKLAPWNPLITAHSSYSITGGSLSLESRFELRGEAYDSPMKVRLHGLRASTDGDGFRKTFGIPLSAAIPLLSDLRGDISLEVPVAGNLGPGGEIRLGVSLVDALREGIMNALMTVVASPFSLVGKALGGVADLAFLRIGEVVFAAGESDLDAAALAELERAATFVATGPDARLGLQAAVVSADLEALGAEGARPNVFRRIIYGGKALLGGRRTLDSKTYTLALELAKARLEAVKQRIVDSGLLSADRVILGEWDEEIGRGSPRIDLRLDRKGVRED